MYPNLRRIHYSPASHHIVNFSKPHELCINVFQIIVQIYTDAAPPQAIHCLLVSFSQHLYYIPALLEVMIITLTVQLRNLSNREYIPYSLM